MVFFGIAPVIYSREWAACFERARLATGLKYESIAAMLGITRPRLHQLLNDGDLGIGKLMRLAHAGDPDGRKLLEAFFHELSLVGGLRHWDGVIAGLIKLTDAIANGMVMAKASTRNSQQERKSA
jgi:transcriptional regulator with XRE-family HTH domain